MADLVDSIRAQIDARIAELRPLVAEAERLQAALTALDGSGPAGGARRPTRRSRPRRRAGATGRPRRGEMRAQVIDHVRAHPGSTAGEVAKALRLNRDSVATLLAVLAKSGELTKAARGYSAA